MNTSQCSGDDIDNVQRETMMWHVTKRKEQKQIGEEERLGDENLRKTKASSH